MTYEGIVVYLLVGLAIAAISVARADTRTERLDASIAFYIMFAWPAYLGICLATVAYMAYVNWRYKEKR